MRFSFFLTFLPPPRSYSILKRKSISVVRRRGEIMKLRFKFGLFIVLFGLMLVGCTQIPASEDVSGQAAGGLIKDLEGQVVSMSAFSNQPNSSNLTVITTTAV